VSETPVLAIVRDLFHSFPGGTEPTEEPLRIDQRRIGLGEVLQPLVMAVRAACRGFHDGGRRGLVCPDPIDVRLGFRGESSLYVLQWDPGGVALTLGVRMC
jgi:hypothetical protein